MDELKSLIERLKVEGIQPRVTIVVDINASDVQAIKTLQTDLHNTGITADVQISLPAGSSSQPAIQPEGEISQAGKERLAVRVKEPRLNCFTYRKTDKAGKPEMVIREPRVLLQQGTVFFVSTTHKINPGDHGDGIIYGAGNLEFYFVVDCPPNPAAVGLYIRKMDIENKS